jgi:hypothetical protein
MDNLEVKINLVKHYQEVKHTFQRVLRKREQGNGFSEYGTFIGHGLCGDLCLENNQLWVEVIKPWFKPENFDIKYLYFNYQPEPGQVLISEDEIEERDCLGYGQWYKFEIEEVSPEWRGTIFWFPVLPDFNKDRIYTLKYGLNELEKLRLFIGKDTPSPKLPDIPSDEPLIV